MGSSLRGRIAVMVVGSVLLGVACREDGDDPDDFVDASTDRDGGHPITADAAPTGDAGGDASTGTPEAGPPDAGGKLPTDAAQPQPAGADTGPSKPVDAGTPDATRPDAAGPSADAGPAGACCPDGKCLCHGPAPTALTSERGPYKTASYTIAGIGCVFYPTDAEPPFAAVTVSDGFLGSGGCGSLQTGGWAPLYASWGIAAMIVDTGGGDLPEVRGRALLDGIEAFKAENTKSGSPLNGKLAGRYGTSGFSMGGGGTSYASRDDKSLLTSIAIMPWGPVTSGVSTPTLVICGSLDAVAPCSSFGNSLYRGIPDAVSKMRVQITDAHAGQPSSGGGKSGQYGLAFQKVFLEGDQRWRPLLVAADSEETNIK
jgi:hypothetical protein